MENQQSAETGDSFLLDDLAKMPILSIDICADGSTRYGLRDHEGVIGVLAVEPE